MKAPNGYGAVYKLPGNRRKPWTVRVTTGYKDNGTPIVKYCGYYATKKEAFAARDDLHKREEPGYYPTFGEVAERFNKEHFPEVSENTRKSYLTSFNKCSVIASKPINELSYVDLQNLIKAQKTGSQGVLRTYIKQVFVFAEVRDIIDKNPAQHLKVDKRKKSTIHYKFSHDEIAKLWEHADDPTVAYILLTIYTGMRPGELFAAEIKDVRVRVNDYIYDVYTCLVVKQGKTKNAIRVVPVHDDALPLLRFIPFEFADMERKAFVSGHFEPALSSAGVLCYTHPETGAKQKHKPHDGRHTFTSQWKQQGLDDGMRAYLQGHTQKDIAGRVYTHYDIDLLRAEIDRLEF